MTKNRIFDPLEPLPDGLAGLVTADQPNPGTQTAMSADAVGDVGVMVADHEPAAPVEPKAFPVDALPDSIRSMTNAIVEINGVPPVLAAGAVFGAVSASVGKGLAVKSVDGLLTHANLYVLLVAESGVGKSRVGAQAFQPIYIHEKGLLKRYEEEELPCLIAELASVENELKGLQTRESKAKGAEKKGVSDSIFRAEQMKAEIKRKMVEPTLCVEDVTAEKLAVIMRDCGGALASLSADARAIVSVVCGRYRSNGETDESLYLKGYSLERFKQHRISRASVVIEKPCLVAVWMIQPDKLREMFDSASLRDGGFLPRFLLCDTLATPKRVSCDEVAFPMDVKLKYTALLSELLTTYHIRTDEPRIICPTADARQKIVDYHNQIVDRMETDLSGISSFACRWSENAWRVALVLHAASHGAAAHETVMAVESAMGAVEIVSWFSNEQVRLLEEIRQKHKEQKIKRILDFLAKKHRLTARDLRWMKIARTNAEAESLLGEMVKDGILVAQNSTGPGRPTLIYLPPKLRTGGFVVSSP